MPVRAKFKVAEIKRVANYEGAQLLLRAVYDPDPQSPNWTFWKATPDGELKLQISNETAVDFFELGQEYYLDFSAVTDDQSSSDEDSVSQGQSGIS
jgi:hypothetical protein